VGTRVTVEDVARHAGVSIATVSRAINESHMLAKATYDRVMDSVEKLGFTPTPAARNLRQQKTQNIALVVPSILNPFFPELVSAVHSAVSEQGYSLLLVDSNKSEQEALRIANSRIADGVLLVGSTSSHPLRRSIENMNIPIVALDRAPTELGATVVQTTNVRGAREVVEHLIEQGHTEIAHITGPAGLSVAEQRTDGYRQALEGNGVKFRPDLVIAGDFSENSGAEAAMQLIESGALFSAIFAANDTQAIGVLAALRRHRIRVPDEVAVAGFDGINLSNYVNPALTTYEQPVGEIAKYAANLLLQRLAGEASDTGDVIKLPGKLIIRESTDREGSRL